MKSRIVIWAVLGALVVLSWRIYIAATVSNPLGAKGIGRALVHLTCPITISTRPQGFYFVLIANAATYALAGILVETTRRYFRARAA